MFLQSAFRTKSIRFLTAGIFGLLALLQAIRYDWLATSIHVLLAVGFLLSDLHYAPAQRAAVPAPPPARRYASMLLIAAALGLFSSQVMRDFHTKQAPQAPPSSLEHMQERPVCVKQTGRSIG